MMNANTAVTAAAEIPAEHLKLLHALKVSARLAVGFVWFWEGLAPKIIKVTPVEIDMVTRSGLWWGSPEQTIFWLGIAMMIAGVILMSGWMERLAQAVATISVLILMALVIKNSPLAWCDPYGGLAKDACLFVCSAVVWFLSPVAGDDSRKKRRNAKRADGRSTPQIRVTQALLPVPF